MRTSTTIAAYGLALAVVVGGAWTAGAAIGPLRDGERGAEAGHTTHQPAPATSDLPGLAASHNGYRIHLLGTALPAGTPAPVRFRVLGPDEQPVSSFEIEHEKELHLIVVRRDGAHYRHLHPVPAPDGTWSTDVLLPAAGTYRLIADFTPRGGPATTLGTDLQVAGDYQPVTSSVSRSATVGDYRVFLDGDLTPGAGSPVTVTVTRHGVPVTGLQPYLGAYGHLVALREADLAYLHVHPLGTPGDGATPAGPQVRFAADVPTAGRYRLFLDFQHDGQVHTAEFTLDTAGTPAVVAPAVPDENRPHGH